MNAIKLLKDDHKNVEKLFKQFEALGDTAHKRKKQIIDKVIHELAVHASIEEQLLYPAMRAKGDELEEMALEALEEHHVVKWTLDELRKMKPEHERYDAKMKVLTEMVRHHIEEEEDEAFPKLQKAFDREELEILGEAMNQAKLLAPTRAHPRSPDEPPGNLIAGTLAMLMDRGMDLVKGARRAPRELAARALRGPKPDRRRTSKRGAAKNRSPASRARQSVKQRTRRSRR